MPSRQYSGAARAKKGLGQNFLTDPNVARKIVACLHLQSTDRVLEIGPGRGALSSVLLGTGAQVLGIEKDFALVLELKKKYPTLDLIAADAVGLAWEGLNRVGIHKIVGNLPYNVASPLIWDIVSSCPQVMRIVFTVQKEVGYRLIASPGSKEYGAFSVWVQNFAHPRLEFALPPAVFRPRPRVDSAVISFSPQIARPSPQEAQALSGLLRICFQQRRKQLKTSLRRLWSKKVQTWFEEQNVSPAARAEELTALNFLSLARILQTEQGQEMKQMNVLV
jgi:16S rRNA (adenine1518-N6/adenine1519-N6)-dimethyltransferase